jgi:hypothetical protein
MATYKLLQDIEAEDHILGPLTFRQFVFLLIALFFGYLCFFSVTKHVPFLLVVFLPPFLFFGFFAMPFGRDQPTEIWALAKLRFLFKPRRRTWDQSGVKELVTITVPKKVEHALTDGLSPYEVESRLKALANTIDSRGWAVKNVAVGSTVQPILGGYTSDRLIDVNALPQAVPEEEMPVADMLDASANPMARQFDQMISVSEQQRRQQVIDEMNAVQPVAPAPAAVPAAPRPHLDAGSKQWFAPHATTSDNAGPGGGPVVIDHTAKPEPAADAAADTAQAADSAAAAPVTPPADPAILSLANNNDLNVATLAREAQKAKESESEDGEVVVSLH